jgi:4-oxalocrotonate tautomerase
MPHIIVKMFPGRSDEQKNQFAEKIADEAVKILGCTMDSVSVSVEEIDKLQWREKVFIPDIREKLENLIKKPGYEM